MRLVPHSGPIPKVPREAKPAKPLRAKPRSKGSRAEREVIDILHAHGWPARRNFASGGYGGADIIGGPPGTSIEVKHRETVCIWDWIAQCEEAAMPTDIPLVVHRVNGKPWHAVLPREDLRVLLEANGWPPAHRYARFGERVSLWRWINEISDEPGIPIVDFARAGSLWYSDLRFEPLLELLKVAQA